MIIDLYDCHAWKKPGSLGAGLLAARPSESNRMASNWSEGLLQSSRLLILTTYNISAAASAQLTSKNTYFTLGQRSSRSGLSLSRSGHRSSYSINLTAAELLRNVAPSGQQVMSDDSVPCLGVYSGLLVEIGRMSVEFTCKLCSRMVTNKNIEFYEIITNKIIPNPRIFCP